jgi:hypothetical protein
VTSGQRGKHENPCAALRSIVSISVRHRARGMCELRPVRSTFPSVFFQ